MPKIALIVVFLAAILSTGCGGNTPVGITSPENETRDLAGLEGTWNYTMQAVNTLEIGGNILVSLDELKYAYIITPGGIYDEYFDVSFDWRFEGGDLLLEHDFSITLDELEGYRNINLDSRIEYRISIDEEMNSMQIHGTGEAVASFLNPDSIHETATITTTYSGIAVRT